MGKIQKTTEQREGKTGYCYPEYTNKELRELETEMNTKYLVKKVLSDGKEHTWYDDEKWQKDNGGLGGLGGVIMAGFLPVQYEVNRDKLEKMYKLQGKTEYAKKEDVKRLVATQAESMTVVNDTPAIVDYDDNEQLDGYQDPLAF